jgi:hypothetical protein
MRKIFLILFFFIVISNGFSDENTVKISSFWEFISKNENRIFAINNQEQTLYNEIYEQIQLIDRNIFVMIDNRIINNKKNIIITSGGNSNFFKLCDQIVELAPNFVHLNPISLLPQVEIIEPFTFGDNILRIEDVRVHFDIDENISLLFILSNEHLLKIRNDRTGQLYNIYLQILFMMTQQLLGERITGEKIKSGDISPISTIVPSVPLVELKNYIK